MRHHRLHRFQVITALATLCVCLGGTLVAGGTASASSSRSAALRANDTFAIVGSANYLVYALATVNFGHPTYYARTKRGQVWKLPDAPSTVDYSISGRYLVANPDSNHREYWWNLITHQHGVIRSDEVAGAAPHGWLAYGAHSSLVEVTPSGARQFVVHLPSPVATALSGPDGVLVYTDEHVYYVRWAAKGHLVRLKIDLHGASVPALVCNNVNAVGAGCEVAQTTELETVHPELVYLDGHAPRSAPAVDEDTDAYIVGHALAWEDSDERRFRSLHGETVTTFPEGRYDTVGPVAAYGKVVLVTAHSLTLMTSSYTDPTIIVDTR